MEDAEFRWVRVNNKDELESFYASILPKIREAAKLLGYAIGVHGSMRRDLDLIAVPWTINSADKESLVNAIHKAACGLVMQSYEWEEKPLGRMATAFPICWPNHETMKTEPSLGHIDLSVTPKKLITLP